MSGVARRAGLLAVWLGYHPCLLLRNQLKSTSSMAPARKRMPRWANVSILVSALAQPSASTVTQPSVSTGPAKCQHCGPAKCQRWPSQVSALWLSQESALAQPSVSTGSAKCQHWPSQVSALAQPSVSTVAQPSVSTVAQPSVSTGPDCAVLRCVGPCILFAIKNGVCKSSCHRKPPSCHRMLAIAHPSSSSSSSSSSWAHLTR